MDRYVDFIAKAWKDFVYKDIVNNQVREDIRESWIRCKKYKVDPMGGMGKSSFIVPIEPKIKQNHDLISVAHPIMEGIYSIVKGSGFSIILCDREGYIIDVIGDEDIMKMAEDLRFIKGALWTEENVGTNAIGTALYLNKPIQTIGAEHYGIRQHSWTCSAAPIQDEDGKLIGCINMSGIYYNAHSHTLGIVTTAAENITKQLSLILSNNLLNATFDSICEGIIVLDHNLHIKKINDRALSILEISLESILSMNIKDILRDMNFQSMKNNSTMVYSNTECNFYINNRVVKCIINLRPMMLNNKLDGIVISFREIQYVHKLINKMAGFRATYKFEDFITENYHMQNIIELAKKAAQSQCNILIEGESGTGKEVIAQAIHNYSQRKGGPFVAVNCASLPRELVESELFGYDRGAFTGANKEGHPGKFELADGGTIFLDEIGELPLDIQAKLLRVLDNNKIIRVGGNYEKQLNVRIIGATNRNLKEEIGKKGFREDLYYRLNVVNIKTIPLRERKEDIKILVEDFVNKLNLSSNKEKRQVTCEYIDGLKSYSWPGNVRELRNVVERDYYLDGLETNRFQLEQGIADDKNYDYGDRNRPHKSLNDMEKEFIVRALGENNWNIVQAAKSLNISRATIYRKIKAYNISKKN